MVVFNELHGLMTVIVYPISSSINNRPMPVYTLISKVQSYKELRNWPIIKPRGIEE